MHNDTKHFILKGNRGKARLTGEEEAQLNARRIAGDSSARQELILRNVGLATRVSYRWAASVNPAFREEVMSEALLGLVEAVDGFDHAKGRLGVFASFRIRARIEAAIAGMDLSVRIPRRVFNEWRKLRRAAGLLRERDGVMPTIEELRLATGLPLRLIRAWVNAGGSSVSLDHSGEDAGGLHEMIAATTEREGAHADARGVIEVGLGALNERQRMVIVRRFGFDGAPTKTLEELADDLNITRERVRQIEFSALRAMREACRRKLHHGFSGVPEEVRCVLREMGAGAAWDGGVGMARRSVA